MERLSFSKLSLIFLFLTLTLNLYSQESCKKCDNRIVYVFDMAVHAPNPYAFTPGPGCDEPCMQRLYQDLEDWRDLHFASPAYKKAIKGYSDPEKTCVLFDMKQNDFMYPCQTPDLFIESKSNNWFVTTIINPGDLKLQPTYSALPPHPEMTDYLIYGILKYDTAGRQYIAKVIALNFRKNEIIWESQYTTKGSDIQIEVGEAARLAASGNGKTEFGTDILPAYEKRKRDESNLQNNGLIALKGKLAFPKTEFEREYIEYLENEEEIVFTLNDCDGTPLKNKEVNFTVTEGSLRESKVTTDENGMGKVVFKAPSKRCTAVLKGEWAFEFPSGKKDITSSTATIKITKPIEELNAQIQIKIINKSANPAFNSSDPEYSSSREINYSSKIVLTINRGKIKRQLDNPKKRFECGKGMNCPIVVGNSYYSVYDTEKPGELKEFTRFPIEVSIDESKKAKRSVNNETKFVTVYKLNSSGTNQYETIGMNINIYYPPADPSVLTPLVPRYLVSIDGGRYTDKLNPQQYPTIGNGKCLSWDYFKEALIEENTSPGIGIPYGFSSNTEENTENDISTPMLTDDVKGLDEWLMNPIGSRTLTLKCRTYHKESNEESEMNAYVTINLTPKLD